MKKGLRHAFHEGSDEALACIDDLMKKGLRPLEKITFISYLLVLMT